MHDRIREPRQDRSQATMIRILDAFEKLLRTGAYESITINEIAAASSTGAGSIYARFDGKRSILLAVHARVRDRARRYFQALFDPDANRDESLEAGIERIARGMFAWHKKHRGVIKTSLLLDDVDIYRGISASFHPWNGQLALMLRARDPELSQELAATTATAILQITTAALQQWVIFGRVSPVGQALTDKELVAVIVAAAMGQFRQLR
jgi:AcrR family transcriptional regulator